MYLVFDVGGTYIKHAMMNRDGSIVTKGKVKTPFTLGAGLRTEGKPSVEVVSLANCNAAGGEGGAR